jgi:hypothetical protein
MLATQALVKSLWIVMLLRHTEVAEASAPLALKGLAITEVMANASSDDNDDQRSDWWELTNFSLDPIDLSACYWTDGNGNKGDSSFQDLVIAPGKSVIFFRARDPISDEGAFRAWWGHALGTNLQEIRSFLKPGLNQGSDAISIYDGYDKLLDKVTIANAEVGITLVSDTLTGELNSYSKMGDNGVGQAETSDDIGSPGTADGPIALTIFEQPTNLEVCPGTDAVLRVVAGGLPRPRYQWWCNQIPIPGATSNALVVPDAEHSADYYVVVANGLAQLTSAVARLTVNVTPAPPTILQPPLNVQVFAGETARFSISACGYPKPQFQWFCNNVPIQDATDRTCVITAAALQSSGMGMIYSVTLWNQHGTNNASAQLTVLPYPKLRITEAMPLLSTSVCTNCPERGVWWELTNRGTNSVDLYGFRHSSGDSSDRALAGARVITNHIILKPGESVIFIKRITPEAFVRWWGKDNLPFGLQVITFAGYGLNDRSDNIFLWSPMAESDNNTWPRHLMPHPTQLATPYALAIQIAPTTCADMRSTGTRFVLMKLMSVPCTAKAVSKTS